MPVDLVVQPMDAQGVQAPDALRVALRVIPDREPAVSVTDPESDETITPQATIPFTIDASDDLRLSTLGWTVDRQQRSGEPGPVRLGTTDRPATEREMSLKDTLNIPSMEMCCCCAAWRRTGVNRPVWRASRPEVILDSCAWWIGTPSSARCVSRPTRFGRPSPVWRLPSRTSSEIQMRLPRREHRRA
jgi:hypothetical protein